tara:strand:+ start:122 stop:523 length:402 start_codon:yes stop_codon:yes gene_type:complete
MRQEAKREFIDQVMNYVIDNFEIDSEYITCVLVNCGASEHLIVAHTYYLLVEVNTNIDHKYNSIREGLKTGTLMPNITCGEYRIGFSSKFANVKIISSVWKAYKTLREVTNFFPVHLVAVNYSDVILSQSNYE